MSIIKHSCYMQKDIVFNRHSERDSELRYSNKKRIFSQYGSIQKIIINKNGYLKNESDYPTYSSYITYSSQIEASLALLVLNNSINIATLFSKGQNALIKTVIIYMKLLIKMISLIKTNPKRSSNSLSNKN